MSQDSAVQQESVNARRVLQPITRIDFVNGHYGGLLLKTIGDMEEVVPPRIDPLLDRQYDVITQLDTADDNMSVTTFITTQLESLSMPKNTSVRLSNARFIIP